MNYNEKITKRSNLEENDSLCVYSNYACQQNPFCFDAFYELLSSVRPARILEIGTAQGGLTIFLNDVCNHLGLNTNIRSYDINELHWYDKIRSYGIDLRVENIFNPRYEGLRDEAIVDFINEDGVTLVLCDGFNKIKEFNLLSQYLKVSDIIMAHDYAYDSDFFKETIDHKLWNWHEISENDIADSVKKYNLQPYLQDSFTNAVWVCKIKN